ncbi:DUF6286 domain-containing protein [Streptomyces sp. NPDC002004]
MSEPQGPGGTSRLPVVEKPGDTGKAAGAGRPGGLGQSGSAASYEPVPMPDDGGRNRRWWSRRRVPAGIVALLLLAGAALLLYDVVAVRLGRPAMQWRRTLAHQLATRPLDDSVVLAGAALVVALGLWLLLLALTPGQRTVLPMRRTHPDVRAGLYRTAAAMVLRDRAMEVSGVQSARVRVSRRKADVRAVSHFRQLDDVRTDLDTVLADGLADLGLARPLRLAVRVRRSGRKG